MSTVAQVHQPRASDGQRSAVAVAALLRWSLLRLEVLANAKQHNGSDGWTLHLGGGGTLGTL